MGIVRIDGDLVSRMLGNGFNSVSDIVTFIISLLLIIGAITTIIALAMNLVKLVRYKDNPRERVPTERNIGACLVCLVALGGFGTIQAIVLSLILT